MASDGAWMTDRIRLGRSVLEVPRLGVGAMTWGSPSGRSRWGPAKLAYGGTAGPEEEQLAFEASLSAGVVLFDTAAMYSGGASERRVGELAEGQSLVRLRRSTIDLYQHHFPSRRISIPALMGLMADAVEAGKVRAVGVSNYSARQLRIAHAALAERGIPLASNQVEYSLLHRAPEVNGVLDACRELGITLIAYQPLAQGVLTGKYRPGDRPKGIRRFGRYFRSDGLKKAQPVVALLGEIGERYSKTPAQVALRWLIEQEGILPIPGAKNGRQAASNAEALSFTLAAAEIEALDQATTAWRR
jgi:aryl-alcohol dehydrogenase-like predicted oxidoreductase